MRRVLTRLLPLVLAVSVAAAAAAADAPLPECAALQPGQFSCAPVQLDPSTGGQIGCQFNRTLSVNCTIFNGVECTGPPTFAVELPCRYPGTKSFSTAMSLSVFLGMFGADRFYLGYPAYGLLKLLTLGLFFGGYYVDVFLIAMQILQPADGTDYIVPYSGPTIQQVTISNGTYYVPLS